jgi:hypothetical protein
MQPVKASFFRDDQEILSDQEIKLEEVQEALATTKMWYGEFAMSRQPPFDSEILTLTLSDGQSQPVKVIVTAYKQNFFFVSFRTISFAIENPE